MSSTVRPAAASAPSPRRRRVPPETTCPCIATTPVKGDATWSGVNPPLDERDSNPWNDTPSSGVTDLQRRERGTMADTGAEVHGPRLANVAPIGEYSTCAGDRHLGGPTTCRRPGRGV